MAYHGKKLLGTSDAFADKIKCPKGTISVRFLVRHKDETALDGLKDMLLVVSRDCSASVDCYSDFGSASKGGDKFKRKQLKKGKVRSDEQRNRRTGRLRAKRRAGALFLRASDETPRILRRAALR